MSVARKKAAPAKKAKGPVESVKPDPQDAEQKPAPAAPKAKAKGGPQAPAEDSGTGKGESGPLSPSGSGPAREQPVQTPSSGRGDRPGPLVHWLKGLPWPKPSWAKDLFRLRPSGLETLVILLIIVAAIMVAAQLFSGGEKPQASPGALSQRAQRRLPPSLIQAINALERNAQADRRIISRLQGRLDSLKMQISDLKDLIKAQAAASSKPPGSVSPSPSSSLAPPGAPGAVAPPRPAPPAARPVAGPNRRLTDLEIRLDDLSRKVKRLERLLRRSRRPR